MTANLPYDPPINTDIDYCRTFFIFVSVAKLVVQYLLATTTKQQPIISSSWANICQITNLLQTFALKVNASCFELLEFVEELDQLLHVRSSHAHDIVCLIAV